MLLWLGFDNEACELVVFDEFEVDRHTKFYPRDSYWEAVDLWHSRNGVIQSRSDCDEGRQVGYTDGERGEPRVAISE